MANAANETSVEVIRCGGTAWEWVRERAITESFPDRVMRLAREAGYEPTGVDAGASPGVFRVHFGPEYWVAVGEYNTDSAILEALRIIAGPDNQPEAVRARKARERMASEAKPSKPGAYVDILFNGVKCPTTGPEFVYLTSAAQAAELYGVESAPHRAMVRAERDGLIVGARDTRTAPVAGTLQPWDTAAHVLFGRPRDAAGAVYPCVRESMVSAIIARQVAAGGVDTEGTRAQAERWCAMLCECVCEGMRATTEQSALMLVGRELEVVEVFETKNYFPRGTPLGRP